MNDEQQVLGIEVRWICPQCERSNKDIMGWTAIPVCAQCGEATDWWVIEEQEAQGAGK